jgi:hypothetical protein
MLICDFHGRHCSRFLVPSRISNLKEEAAPANATGENGIALPPQQGVHLGDQSYSGNASQAQQVRRRQLDTGSRDIR